MLFHLPVSLNLLHTRTHKKGSQCEPYFQRTRSSRALCVDIHHKSWLVLAVDMQTVESTQSERSSLNNRVCLIGATLRAIC